MTPPEFFEWLDERLQEKNWSDRQLCIHAGLAHSVLSKARNGTQAIGFEAAIKFADALDVPQEHFLRLAGLLPPSPPDTAALAEWAHLIDGVPDDVVEMWIASIRAMRERMRAAGKVSDKAEKVPAGKKGK